MIAWSYSRLEDFELCPLMFLEKYIKKSIKFEPNEAMQRGSERHSQLEREVIRATHSQEPVVQEVSHVWPIIKGFVGMHSEVIVEQEIALTKNLKFCSWFDKKTWLRVKMDAIGRVDPYGTPGNHEVNIIDWKTGQVKYDTSQLRICNMVAMLKWPQTSKVSSFFVFIDHQQTSTPVISTREDLPHLIQEYSDRAEAIQIANEKDEWPARKNYKCKWCKVPGCKYGRGWCLRMDNNLTISKNNIIIK